MQELVIVIVKVGWICYNLNTMENGPKQDIESSENISVEQSKELQETLKKQAEAILEQYKDVPEMEVFLNQKFEHKDIHSGDVKKVVLDCVEECERLCRAAVGMEADNIIVLDRSGRPYGFMFLQVLRMIRLEYSKINNRNPEDVKLPQIKYVNPSVKIANLKRPLSEGEVSYLQKIVDENSVNVVFDESTNDEFPGYGLSDKDIYGKPTGLNDITKQYNNLGEVMIDKDTKDWGRLSVSVERASKIIAVTTKSKTYPFIGYDGGVGGRFGRIYEALFPDMWTKKIISDIPVDNWPIAENSQNLPNSWIPKRSSELSQAEINALYNLARTIIAFVIRDIYEKSFSDKKYTTSIY